MKLDSGSSRGQTQLTVTRTTRTLELDSPMPAQLIAFVLTIVTVILILPR